MQRKNNNIGTLLRLVYRYEERLDQGGIPLITIVDYESLD